MLNKFLGICLLFTAFSCVGQKKANTDLYYDPDRFITLNLSFIDSVRIKISFSQKEFLIASRKNIYEKKIDNSKYLDLLNVRINDVDIFTGDTFYNVFLKKIINDRNIENINVKSIYFINLGYNSEIYQWDSAILIENFDGNIELYKNNGNYKAYLNSDIINFTNDWLRNYTYSGKKSLLISGYFTIDRITPNGANEYKVESIVAPEMQYFELEILKKFYELND